MAQAEGGKSGKTKKRNFLIIGAVVVVAAVAVVWFLGIFPHRAAAGHATRAVVQEKPVFVDLPDIVSNLDTGGRRSSFIKLHAKLQVANAADAAALQGATARLLDIFQTYLRSMRPDELQGGEATYRLREALMNRVDIVMSPVQVQDLLFTELLVQ